MQAQSTMEKIELLKKQTLVVTKKLENIKTDDQRQCYSAALEKVVMI